MAKTLINTLTRRSFMGVAAAGAATVAIAPKASSQALDQSAVQYQLEPKGDQQCSNCGLFIPNADDPAAAGACQLVQGEIMPQAWCAIWAPIAN